MTRPTMDDDAVPATRGDVRQLGYELRSEMARLATRDELHAEVAKLATRDELHTEVEKLARNQVMLHEEIRGAESSLRRDILGIEASVTREIKAAHERFRADFGVVLDKMKAEHDFAAAQTAEVRADLDAHRTDKKVHRRR